MAAPEQVAPPRLKEDAPQQVAAPIVAKDSNRTLDNNLQAPDVRNDVGGAEKDKPVQAIPPPIAPKKDDQVNAINAKNLNKPVGH